MTREAKLGEIVYSTPGTSFSFTPPKQGRSYRFHVGPANGRLWISVCNPRQRTETFNKRGEDFVDCVCDAGEHIVYVHGCKTAFQFTVTRTPFSLRAWIRNKWGI